MRRLGCDAGIAKHDPVVIELLQHLGLSPVPLSPNPLGLDRARASVRADQAAVTAIVEH